MFNSFRSQTGSEIVGEVFDEFRKQRERLALGITLINEQILTNEDQIAALEYANDTLQGEINRAEQLDSKLAEFGV